MNEPLVDPLVLRPGDRGPAGSPGPTAHLSLFPAPARWATRGTPAKVLWKDLLAMARQPELWPGGASTGIAAQRLPALSFARFRDDTRVVTRDEALSARESRLRVTEVHGLVLDYVDEPAVDGEHLRRWWGRHGFVAFTTGFHLLPMDERPPGPRWRLMLPLTRPVDLATAETLHAWARHPRHDTGILHERPEAAWSPVPYPAIGPGGYRWFAQPGAALDPDACLEELAEWHALDIEVHAGQVLEGTRVADQATLLALRHGRPRFPPPPVEGLDAALGPLGAGRVVALLGGPGSGRTQLALQWARVAAEAGRPVLVVLTRLAADEAVARWLAADLGVPAESLLAEAPPGLDAAAEALDATCPGLHVWSPPADLRTPEAVRERVRAVRDAHGGEAPLVVVDGVEGWAGADPGAGHALAAHLRDLAHPGPDRPGALVVLVGDGEVEGPHPSPLVSEASIVLTLGWSDAGGTVRIAKHRGGAHGEVAVRFDPVRGVVAAG